MIDPHRNADATPRQRSSRLTTLAAIVGLGLGSLVLTGCGNGEEELPPMEEPAGESSSMDQNDGMGQNDGMAQDDAMDSDAPAMEQDDTMDPSMDQQTSQPMADDEDEGS